MSTIIRTAMNFKQKNDNEKRQKEPVYFSELEKQDILDACKIEGRSFSEFCRFYALLKAKEIINGSKK